MIYMIENEDDIIAENTISNRNLLACLTFCSWARGVSYLRLFKQTRSLIRLVIEVVKDMKAFAIVLFMSVIGFTLTFFSLVGNVSYLTL